MASSDHLCPNNGDHRSEDEEQEEEYEEIEEEIEVEVEVEEEEEFEEIEEEEVVEEIEEEVEEEVEEVVEEEVEDEEPEEEEEEEPEEEYEEVEEEEYEEIEVEVEEEVTDDEEDDATMSEVKADDNVVVVAKSDSPVLMVANKEDGSLDVKFRDEVCLISGHPSDLKSEASILTDNRTSETFCRYGGSSAYELQNGNGKCRDEVCLGSGYTSSMKSEASILTRIRASETICPDGRSSSRELQSKDGNEISSVAGSSISPTLLEHIAGPFNDESDSIKNKQGQVEQTTLVSASAKHVSAPDNVTEQSDRTTNVKESKPLSEEADLQSSSRQDMEKKDSRSLFPRVRSRSLSPGAEDCNKKPAISCEYFAKGWCIKGSSCRFLHKSDHANPTQVEGDMRTITSESQPDKGSGEGADASDILICKSSSTAVKDIQKKHGEDLKLRPREDKDKTPLHERTSSPRVSVDLPNSSYKDYVRSISTHREVDAYFFNERHSSDTRGLSIAEGGSMLRHNFFSKHGSSSREMGISSGSDSILRLVEESAAMRRRYSLDIMTSVPSYHISSYKGTSLHHSSPMISRSDLNKFSDASYSQTPFTPYNWEPSVPFRSAFIPPVNRSSDAQYDPFRDSIEEPDSGRASFKQSSNGQTQNGLSGQNSLEFQKILQINNWEKSYNSNDKTTPAVEADSAATSASDAQNKNMIEEENPMVPGSVKALLKASRGISDVNSKLHSDLKVENGRQPNELYDEESKAIRFFRAALIEFVKELMKPIWHEGRLSKDVYKAIVQKAEDKILSTLQPSQVPNTSESAKLYLSSSRPKILKLIQAYVDKYGRF